MLMHDCRHKIHYTINIRVYNYILMEHIPSYQHSVEKQ